MKGTDFMMLRYYFPITRYRRILTQEYITEEVNNGAFGYTTYEEAKAALDAMDTDDSDYEVCVCIDGEWHAVGDGVVIRRIIP